MGIKLQTIVPIAEGEPKIDYHSNILLLGSCFSENIGDKLDYFKFASWSNPFGVIFNPYSLEQLLIKAVSNLPFDRSNTLEKDGVWCSFEVHSQWSASTREELIDQLNAQRLKLRKYLETTTHCIITLGTAWVYRYKKTDTWVANCQKVPSYEFQKELMDTEVIAKCLQNMVELLKNFRPEMRVIFTVSPVRHIKDGYMENHRSKGRLLDAIQATVDATTAVYFPSYEIMMDELRDYRFYADDLLHPNSLGIDYIWERFQETWIDREVIPLMAKVSNIQKSLAHRSFNPDSKNTVEFNEKLAQKMAELSKEIPNIQF